LAFGDAEVEVFEEGWDASEEADALDASGFGLIEECTYEEATGSAPLRLGIDDDGANLGEVLSAAHPRKLEELSSTMVKVRMFSQIST
jgi:hypothetical protein